MFYRLLGKICFYLWVVPFVATIVKAVFETVFTREVARELQTYLEKNKIAERRRPNYYSRPRQSA